MFAQPFDHSFNDLFNQYVNMDTLSTDGNKDVSFPSEFEQMFPLDSFSTDCGDQSPITSTTQSIRQSAQNWGKDLWSLPQNAGCSTELDNLAFQDPNQSSALLDSNVDLEASLAGPSGLPHASEPRSTPSTPPATPGCKAKGGLFTPKTIRRHRDSNDRRGLLRKQSFSPNLMRSSQAQKVAGRMVYPEVWAQRLQNYAIRNADESLPLSPPPSDILVQQENTSKHTPALMNHSIEGFRGSTELPQQYDAGYFTQSPAIPMPSPSANALTSQQQRYFNQSNSAGLTPSPPSADDIFSSPHSSDPHSMSSWNSESFTTPAFHYTPELQGNEAQAWWSPMPTGVAQRQAPYQEMIASPAPQRPIQTSANHNDLLQGGLMIQMDPTSFDISSSFPSSTIPSTTNAQDSHSYTLGAPITQQYVNSSSFTTPIITNSSRSPSLSPKTGISPKNGNGMAMKTTQRRPHIRKLSGQSTVAPKPLKGPGNLSTSPKNGKSVTVSFVNFTANDSKKILTGVAPSGSSKTKARREQEARDRRRKLSEAALNAVRQAGGDVEALEAVFC
ncbi:hypothetical protein BJY04DRAFT_45746 [Aspergillus karnatakaensis]|uniref:developmental regulatory protein WetA n=1 Tax=Aspergillus karnatakaensis TaxID=1810916 RepID=UPI003CCE2588